jgi:hypothetical protein
LPAVTQSQRKQRKQRKTLVTQPAVEVLPRVIMEIGMRMDELRPAYEEYVRLSQVKTELERVRDTKRTGTDAISRTATGTPNHAAGTPRNRRRSQ